MSVQALTNYFLEYGAFFIFWIVFLEYLNLPGFPAGVIMPTAGIWAAKGKIDFALLMLLTVAAGLLGSWMLYFVGRWGGDRLFGWYFKKFPGQRPMIEAKMEMLRQKGCIGVFVSKLIPAVRTLISIPAGMIQMNFVKYTISSVCGVFVWNLVFIGAGYLLGETAIELLG